MGFFTRFRWGQLHLGRLEAFSDGVFAIIVTLLVLELHIPHLSDSRSTSELAHQLVELLPKFLSWLISFVIVCKFWLNHHQIMSLPRHANYGLIWLNSIFLTFQSFVPFPTAVMGEYPTNPLAVCLFGVVMGFNTLLFIALHSYILRNLIKPELVELQPLHVIPKSFGGVACYLAGATMAWISVYAAFTLYLLTPLFFITPLRDRQRQGSAQTGG